MSISESLSSWSSGVKFNGLPLLFKPEVLGCGLWAFVEDTISFINFLADVCLMGHIFVVCDLVSVFSVGVFLIDCLIFDFACCTLLFCFEAFNILVFDFFRRFPAKKGGTNFAFGFFTIAFDIVRD